MTPTEREERTVKAGVLACLGAVVLFVGRELAWTLWLREVLILAAIGACVVGALWLSDRLIGGEDPGRVTPETRARLRREGEGR